MNNAAISKEELLDAAEIIIKTDGLSKLNMRDLAKTCDISVGCIYNYYSSKTELLFALIERFWYRVFHTADYNSQSTANFLSFVEETYHRMKIGLEGFTDEFLNQISTLNYADRSSGRKVEADYFAHIKMGMLKVLRLDKKIREDVWTDLFTTDSFIDFVFGNLMHSLRNGQKDCSFLLEIIKRSIY